MVKITNSNNKRKKKAKNVYEYKDKVMDTVLIDKKLRDDITKFCKERKISRSHAVSEFYKTILIRFRDGSLGATNGYITVNLFA